MQYIEIFDGWEAEGSLKLFGCQHDAVFFKLWNLVVPLRLCFLNF